MNVRDRKYFETEEFLIQEHSEFLNKIGVTLDYSEKE